MSNLSNLSKGGGNVKTPPSLSKDNFQSSKWKGNYHLKVDGKQVESFEQVFERIEKNIIPLCDKYIFGEEYGETKDTPHIEFAFTIKNGKRMRRSALKKLFCKEGMFLDKMKGTLLQQDYCKKEGNKVLTNIKFPRPIALMDRKYLSEKQCYIVDLFKEYEDPLFGRMLYWFWEDTGNWGKSKTALHMVDYCDALLVGGAGNDILYGFTQYIEKHGDAPKTLIFDIPRACENNISYKSIESIKNGCIFSPKYESGMVRFNRPHIVVFSNFHPDLSSLSEDRWIIEELTEL